MTRQFMIYRKERAPVAYASWALASEEVEKRLATGEQQIAPGAAVVETWPATTAKLAGAASTTSSTAGGGQAKDVNVVTGT